MPFDFPGTPSDGQQVAGPNGSIYRWSASRGLWTGVLGTAIANTSANNAGRNRVHNGYFWVWQRGVTNFAATGGATYCCDRWVSVAGGSDSSTVSAHTPTSAEIAAVGNETMGYNAYALQMVVTGSSAAGSSTFLQQGIEWVADYSAKTVTFSVWAWAATAGLKLGLAVTQYFGSGSSASPEVDLPVVIFTLSTIPQRFSATFALPSFAGKTLDPGGEDGTFPRFFFSAASGNAQAASLGVQSGTFFLWGAQFEVGNQVSPLEFVEYSLDMLRCQRFYQINNTLWGFAPNANEIAVNWTPIVPMRRLPTMKMLTTTPYAEVPPWTTAATGSGSAVDAGHATDEFGFDLKVTGFSGLTAGAIAMLRYNQLEFAADL